MALEQNTGWKLLKASVGRTIKKIEALRLMFEGEFKSEELFALQITFTDNSVLLLNGGTDGESLIVKDSEWLDPYTGRELNQEALDFFREYGTDTLTDVSNDTPFNSMIGKRVDQLRAILAGKDKLSGVEMTAGEAVLNFVFVWDECHILWGKDNPYFETMRVTVSDE